MQDQYKVNDAMNCLGWEELFDKLKQILAECSSSTLQIEKYTNNIE